MIVVGSVVLYAVLRLALYRVLWRRTEMTIQAAAQENSTFIETVRAIQSLKLFNRESEREGQWLNRYAEVANANVRLGRVKIAFSTMNDLIFGLEMVLTVFLAARLALANSLKAPATNRTALKSQRTTLRKKPPFRAPRRA
jgi:ATP-binding cassette subfamily B protein RaxB